MLLLPALAATQDRPKVQPREHQVPLIRVLEQGAAPHSPLRYALKARQDLVIVARGDMKVSRTTGEGKTIILPTLTTPVRLTPQKEGVGFIWLKGSFTTAADQPPDNTTGHLLTALEGSTGLLMTEARGVISRVFLRARPADKGTDGKLENRSIYAMEMGKGVLTLLEVPMPEEPMGIGGRWQVERLADRGMLTMRQFTTFTLVKREGNLLELSYRFGGKADEASGMRPHELKLEVSGGGKCTVNLGLPMPVSLEDEILISATMTRSDGQATLQSTRVGTRIESQ